MSARCNLEQRPAIAAAVAESEPRAVVAIVRHPMTAVAARAPRDACVSRGFAPAPLEVGRRAAVALAAVGEVAKAAATRGAGEHRRRQRRRQLRHHVLVQVTARRAGALGVLRLLQLRRRGRSVSCMAPHPPEPKLQYLDEVLGRAVGVDPARPRVRRVEGHAAVDAPFHLGRHLAQRQEELTVVVGHEPRALARGRQHAAALLEEVHVPARLLVEPGRFGQRRSHRPQRIRAVRVHRLWTRRRKAVSPAHAIQHAGERERAAEEAADIDVAKRCG